MPAFSVGVVSFACAAFLALVTLLAYWLNRISKWYKKEEPPKDRIVVGIVFMSVVGFLAGSFAQPAWDRAQSCRAQGNASATCLFSLNG